MLVFLWNLLSLCIILDAQPQKGRQKFLWGFVNAEKGIRLFHMSCKLTSVRTSQCVPRVRALWQRAIIVPLQAQIIFLRDATQPVDPHLLCVSLTIPHWSECLQHSHIEITFSDASTPSCQACFEFNSALILLANNFSFTWTDLI